MDMRSGEPDELTRGLNILGASGKVDAIARIVPLLHSDHELIRLHAGRVLEQIVSGNELRRRDMNQPGRIVLRPRSSDDIDLRPLAWIIVGMMRALMTATPRRMLPRWPVTSAFLSVNMN